MKSLEYLRHIADVRMKIQGSSEEGLFCAGLEGIGRILKADVFEKPQQADEIMEISLVSGDMTTLLVKSLEQLTNVAMLPGITKASIVMPDVHGGMAFLLAE